MTVKDIAESAQTLANYCYREGEAADVKIISGAIKVLNDKAAILKMDRTGEMVKK